MKNVLRAAAVVTALALSTTAHAQRATQPASAPAAPAASSTAPAKQLQIGLGVGLTTGIAANSPNPGHLLVVPLQLGANIRVEPFLGWVRSDVNDVENSDVTLGVGAFLVQPLATQLQAYGGGRLGSQWISSKQPVPGGSTKTEQRNTLFALAAGAEYLPIPRVALGAEFQLGYLFVGDEKVTTPGGTVETDGGSASFTQATLFARIYFM